MKSHRRSPLSLAIHALILGLAVPSAAVMAQTEEAAELDRVEVTGSRIKKADIEGQSPVLTIDAEDLERTGITSVGDILQQLTSSGSALNTKFNSSGNFGYPPDGGGVGAGSTTVDLRHLDAKRVLVLVDGIRWVNETSASGVSTATDLNTIPLSVIDRIEVLGDGASTIYGSDAIAGVVNVITKKSMDGGEANLYFGTYDEGDGETTSGDVAFGSSSDRMSFIIGAAYTDQETILSRDREQSSFPVPGTGVTRGSSATPGGRFIYFDPANPDEVFDATNPGDGFRPFTGADRFNFSQYNLLLTPSKRTNVFGQSRFSISDNITWYLKAMYNDRESVNQAAPEPIFLGPEAGTGNPLADNIFISASNPYNPFGYDLDSSSNLILIGRRPVEGGPRIFNQDVSTWYIGTGVEGDFQWGDRLFFWDVNFSKAENEATQQIRGTYNIRHIAQALGPIENCQAPCVPLDIFSGPGSITPEMLRWIQYIGTDTSANNLRSLTANLSGDLFQLPAGSVSFATGYEHRNQEGYFQPDAVTVAGDGNGVPSLPTAGEYNVDEYYLEFNVPLLADMPGAQKLDLSLAGRNSDYSTFGGESTFKVGLRWQPTDDLVVRGTFAEGFRAPSIGELFGAASRFDATLNDPCSNAVGQTATNCAQLGVPAGYEQANPQISVVTGGNAELDPELADSFTAGFVYSPSWAEDSSWASKFDIEFTYYDHEIEGAIAAVNAQTQLNLCVDTLDPIYCNGITRAATGGINGFQNRLTNIGQIETNGYDLNFFWVSPEFSFGQLSVNWMNTFVDDYVASGAGGSLDPDGPGVEVADSGIPEWSSNLILDWSKGDWGASWTVRHLSDLTEVCSDFLDNTANSFTNLGLCSHPNETDDSLSLNKLGSTTYHDVQVRWKLPIESDVVLTAGINNVLDKAPPTCLTCSLNGYDASNYDLPGQFGYLRANIRF